MNIEWAPRAVDELAQLRDYIAQDSPFYARQFTERLVLAVERLATLPRSGRIVPEAGHQDAIREVLYHGYRLIYRILDDQQLVPEALSRMSPPLLAKSSPLNLTLRRSGRNIRREDAVGARALSRVSQAGVCLPEMTR